MANHPPFAILNHAADDSRISRESPTPQIGIRRRLDHSRASGATLIKAMAFVVPAIAAYRRALLRLVKASGITPVGLADEAALIDAILVELSRSGVRFAPGLPNGSLAGKIKATDKTLSSAVASWTPPKSAYQHIVIA